MSNNILLIKNMVCNRCVMTVEQILQKEKVPFHKVLIGEIHLEKEINVASKSALAAGLNKIGFELIDNHAVSVVEKIKSLVIRRARNESDKAESRTKLSVFLSDKLHHEYTYLSSLFSAVEGRTIENYFIEQRIEKAKELLVYGQLTLSEIAHALDYSSVAHLSAQFKKVTGLTPSHFKSIGENKRRSLDQV